MLFADSPGEQRPQRRQPTSGGARSDRLGEIGPQIGGADGGELGRQGQCCRLEIGAVDAQRARLKLPTDARVAQKGVEGVGEVHEYSLCQEIPYFV